MNIFRRLYMAWHYSGIAHLLINRGDDLAECFSIDLEPLVPSKRVRIGTSGSKHWVRVWIDGSEAHAKIIFELLTREEGKQVFCRATMYDPIYSGQTLIARRGGGK